MTDVEMGSSHTKKRSSSPSTADLTLFCCLVGSGTAFPVDISSSLTVGHLKEKIQKQFKRLKEIDADKLSLFKVSIPSGHDVARKLENAVDDIEPLDPTTEIIEVFPDEPPEETVHIVVKLPDADIYNDHSQKRPRLVTEDDPSPVNKWMLTMHQFLWDDKGEDRLKALITTTTERVPPLYANTEEQPTSHLAKKYDLTKIPGYKAYEEEQISKNQLVKTFYYRDEYKEVDELDSESATGPEAFHILLLGHPGIGKTTYLIYRLVHRLARKQPTCLVMSPKNRYLFVDQGVFHLLGDEVVIYKLVLRHRTPESLFLVDLNDENPQMHADFFLETRAIVASSPRPSRYRGWVKQRGPTTFVMKTWSWEEVYTAQSMSLVKRDDDAWRKAFLKWGGSAQHLFSSTEQKLEKELADAAQAADSRIGTEISMENTHTHRLVMSNPVHDNGTMFRDILKAKLISPYITRVLLEKCKEETTRFLIDRFQRSFVHSSDEGLLFEEFGHTIVRRSLKQGFKAQQLSRESASALPSPQTMEFKFADFDDQTPQYFKEDQHPAKLDTDRYYRPDTKTFAGIDALALGNQTIVLFQFTVAKEHQIDAKWLYSWYPDMKDWEWHLIFVIPRKRSQLNTFQSLTHETLERKISQYVLEIDVSTYMG